MHAIQSINESSPKFLFFRIKFLLMFLQTEFTSLNQKEYGKVLQLSPCNFENCDNFFVKLSKKRSITPVDYIVFNHLVTEVLFCTSMLIERSKGTVHPPETFLYLQIIHSSEFVKVLNLSLYTLQFRKLVLPSCCLKLNYVQKDQTNNR